MVEKRKHKRSKSPQGLPILHAKTGEQLGMLVDLSLGGLLMMSIKAMEINRTYPLQIILPLSEGESINIRLSAEVAWIDSTNHQGTFWAGFHVIDISEYELERIGQLVDKWALEENSTAELKTNN